MTAVRSIRSPMHIVDSWFVAPEPNAAGRMGLFRIVYAIFYLWHLSLFDLRASSGMPRHHQQRLAVLTWLPQDPSPAVLQGLDMAMVCALVLLALGLRVRLMTCVVLLIGVVREAYPSTVDVENANVFLVFYIPLFMLIVGRWGDTYSIDATWRRERDATRVEPSDSTWEHFLPARASLVILVALFVSSPLFKAAFGGTWLKQHDLFSMLMLQRNVEAAALGLPTNPLAPWIAVHPTIGWSLQLSVLVFEGLFFLALLGRSLRTFFFAVNLVFHSINALWVLVTFTPILAVYAMFVDWQALWSRVAPRRALPSLSGRTWTAIALVLAPVVMLTWHLGLRAVFNAGGLLNWQTPWFFVLPLAATCAALEVIRLPRWLAAKP